MQNNVACITESCHIHNIFPRAAWSNSIHSVRALRLPVPKPWWLFLLIISRKTVGLHRLREDLQKIAIVIVINQNLQFLQLCQVLLNLQSYLNHHFLFEKFRKAPKILRYYLNFFRVCKTLSEQIISKIGEEDVEELNIVHWIVMCRICF